MSKKKYVDEDYQNAFRPINLPDPSSAQHPATKNYVDNALIGVRKLVSARVMMSTNVDISQLNNGDTLDGVSVATNDTVILAGQTSASEDGWYTVGATAGTTARLASMPAGTDARGVAAVIGEGTANGNKFFIQTAEPAILDTDGLTFTAIEAGVTYSADGNGIELASTTFSLELDGTTLTKGGAGLRIGSGAAGAGLTEASGVLAVGQGAGVTVAADTVTVDRSTIAGWSTALGPASAGSSITQAHGLGHRPASIEVQIEATGEYITDGVDVTADTTNIVITFGASQADRSAYRLSWAG